jgi:carboxypeptidase Q
VRRSFILLSAGLLALQPGCRPAQLPAADVAPAAAPSAPAAGLAALARQVRAGSEVPEHAYRLIDLIGPRMSDSPGGAAARRYVLDLFHAWGLAAVREESFPLLAWHRGSAALTLRAPAELSGREASVLSLGHVGTHSVEAELIDAGFAVAEDFHRLGERVRGRIILAHPGQPEGYGRWVHRSEKIALAERAGAAGFVLIAPGSLVQIGVATLGDHETRIPAVAVDLEGGSWLARIVERHPDGVRARIETTNRMAHTHDANILADIPGRTHDVVLVGAHLDSWDLATGAVDNGSGSIAVLELARALSAHVHSTGEQPLRTIRFALWMGEELGLYGSTYHVAQAVRTGTIDRYAAVLNLDVVGAPVGLGMMGRPEAAPLLEPVARTLAADGWPLATTMSTHGGLYSDHAPFLYEGIPILDVQSRLPERARGVGHTTADTRDKLDEDGLSDTAAVAAALLWAVANAPELPFRRWPAHEIGPRLDEMGFRDALERSGEWRWD